MARGEVAKSAGRDAIGGRKSGAGFDTLPFIPLPGRGGVGLDLCGQRASAFPDGVKKLGVERAVGAVLADLEEGVGLVAVIGQGATGSNFRVLPPT